MKNGTWHSCVAFKAIKRLQTLFQEVLFEKREKGFILFMINDLTSTLNKAPINAEKFVINLIVIFGFVMSKKGTWSFSDIIRTQCLNIIRTQYTFN